MKTEQVHTLILGAGPAGLAAGYVLAKAGKNAVIVERDKVHGGLMRSIRHGDFVVDVGRKELYSRLEKVDEFWSSVIGSDYRPYLHRGGSCTTVISWRCHRNIGESDAGCRCRCSSAALSAFSARG